MRIFLTIFLSLSTAAVCGLVWMIQSPEYRSFFFPKPALQTGQKVFHFDIFEVRKIEITNNEGVTATFIYRNNEWFAEEPWKDRADNLAPIISFAHTAIVQKSIPLSEAEPAKFGFGTESHQVRIASENGETLAEFELGLSSPWHIQADGSETKFPCVYLRRTLDGADSPTLLCHDPQFRIRELFKNKLVGLRNYFVTNPFDIPKLQKLSIKRKESIVELERDEQAESKRLIPASIASWLVKKPLEVRADQAAMKQLINTLKYLTASELIDPKGVTLPENDEELIEVELFFKDREKPTLLRIYPSTKENNIVLATISDRPNVIFQIPYLPSQRIKVAYSQLPNNANDIRARHILELSPPAINTVTIVPKKGRPVRLTKFREWNLVTKTNAMIPVNAKALNNFITALSENNIRKFVSDAPNDLTEYGLDDPALKVYLIDIYNNVQAVHIGKSINFEENNLKQLGFFAKTDGKESIWIVDSSVVSSMDTREWAWLPLEIFQESITSIRNITRVRRGKPTQHIDFDYAADRLHVYEGEKINFQDNEEVTHRVDATKAAFFITTMCNLVASQRIDPNSIEAAEALKNPIMSLSITYITYVNDRTMPARTSLAFAPMGSLSSSKYFYVKDLKSGAIFAIERKVVEYLFDSIRYEN